MTTTSYRVRVARWVLSLFPSRHGCTVTFAHANDDNDIPPARLFVPSRRLSPVTSRARGTMTTTSYGTRSAVVLVTFFRALFRCPVASCTRNDERITVWRMSLFPVAHLMVRCTRNDDNDILRSASSAVGIRHFFPSALLICPVASFYANDDNDILQRPRTAVGVRHLFPSKHYSDVRSRLVRTRNDANDIPPH
ncbi:hypothetical protein TNCV_3695901 [Trichonephila clavipes]|nr:hypothetical protein TNCV_3695901 [Trichonephila clavipes]